LYFFLLFPLANQPYKENIRQKYEIIKGSSSKKKPSDETPGGEKNEKITK